MFRWLDYTSFPDRALVFFHCVSDSSSVQAREFQGGPGVEAEGKKDPCVSMSYSSTTLGQSEGQRH
jgi:hypothetical protein